MEKKININKILLFTVIALSVIALIIVGFFAYKTALLDKEEEKIEVNQVEEDFGVCNIGEDCDQDYLGQNISAQLPTGWSIVEYFNGGGTDSLPDYATYVGLTGMEILNGENVVVFSLQAVSGVGFTGCDLYPIFSDNNEEYMQEQMDSSEVMGDTFNSIDYTSTEYSEFMLLGTRFRRIDDKYFYDTNTSTETFEPICHQGILSIDNLSFYDTDNVEYKGYWFGLTPESQESEWKTIDVILESIELI